MFVYPLNKNKVCFKSWSLEASLGNQENEKTTSISKSVYNNNYTKM